MGNEARDAMMLRVKEFMDRVYPVEIFTGAFGREQVELIAACFVLDEILQEGRDG